MVQQSLAILILLSAFAGFVTMVARAMVVRKIRIKKDQQGKISKLHERLVFYGFFIIEGFRSAFLYLSTWFGPVSLSFVIYNAMKLLLNILFIGVLLKLETFDKDTQVATAVIILSVVLITFLGPSTQENQDPEELILGSPIAMIWLGFLGLMTMISSYMMLCTKIKKRSPLIIDTVFLSVATGCHVLAGTISRVAGTVESDVYKWLLMGLVGILAIIVAIEIYRQASHVSSLAKFIPRVLVLNVSVNAVTGLLVWEEGKVIFSWVGYVAAYLVMFLGIYLMSNLDFFIKNADEVQEYHRQELEAFFGEIEARLERAEEESKMNRHQIRILDASREIGLKRAISDPEIGSTFSTSMVSCEQRHSSEISEELPPTKMMKLSTPKPSTKEIVPFSGIYKNGGSLSSSNNKKKRFHHHRTDNSKHSRSISCNSSVSSIGSSASRSALSESIHEIKKHFLESDGLSTSERMKKVATTLRRSSLESCGTENTASEFLSTSERLRKGSTTLRRSSLESCGTANTPSEFLSTSERNNRKVVVTTLSRRGSIESSCCGTENTEDKISTNKTGDTEEEEEESTDENEFHFINYRSSCAVSILESIDSLSDIESFDGDLNSSMDLEQESSFQDVELGASLFSFSDCSSISC